MAGTFPTTVPYYSKIDLVSNQPAIVSRSESGRRQSRKASGHIWEMKITFPEMSRAEFAEIDAFIMKQDGAFDSFDIAYTLDNQGTWIDDASPLVDGAIAKGATSVTIDALTNGKTVVAGDIFKMGGNKVYKVVTGGTVALGQVTVEFRPPAVAAIADNQAVTHTDVNFHMAIVGTHEFAINPPERYGYEIDLEEVF